LSSLAVFHEELHLSRGLPSGKVIHFTGVVVGVARVPVCRTEPRVEAAPVL
jgi:hypothetical protein